MIVPYLPPSPHVYLVGQDPAPTVVFVPWWVVWSLVGVVAAVIFALAIAVGHKEKPRRD